MGDSKSDPFKKLIIVFGYSFLGILFLVFTWFCGTFIYEAFYTPVGFDQLVIKKGILTKVGKCRRMGSIHIPVEIMIGDISKKFKLPCEQNLSSLSHEIGNLIEIRYDPSHLSFPGSSGISFLNEVNIWHVSTIKKTYLDYTIKLNELHAQNKHRRNIVYIVAVLCAIIILKNFNKIKKRYSNLQTERSFVIDDLEGTHTFRPDQVRAGCFCYMLVIATIIFVYCSIFMHPLYLFGSIPLTPLTIASCYSVRKHKHSITVSPIGIRYAPFSKIIQTDTIKWSNIKSIAIWRPGGSNKTILVELIDRKKTSSLQKIGAMGRDLNIGSEGFEESDRLNDTIFQMYKYYNNKGKVDKVGWRSTLMD